MDRRANYRRPRKYGADRFGFEVTSVEALRRAQGFRLGGVPQQAENLSEPVGDFTLDEYMEAFMENAIRNIVRTDASQTALVREHTENRVGDTPVSVDAPATVRAA